MVFSGQRMAQFICQDHPRFLSELRQRMSNGGSRSNLDTQTNETAMDEDSQTDSNSTGSTKKNNQTNPPWNFNHEIFAYSFYTFFDFYFELPVINCKSSAYNSLFCVTSGFKWNEMETNKKKIN